MTSTVKEVSNTVTVLLLAILIMCMIAVLGHAQQKKHTPERFTATPAEVTTLNAAYDRLNKAQADAQKAFERAEEMKALAQKEYEAASLQQQLAEEKIAHAHDIEDMSEYKITQGAKPDQIDFVLKDKNEKAAATPPKKDDKQE